MEFAEIVVIVVATREFIVSSIKIDIYDMVIEGGPKIWDRSTSCYIRNAMFHKGGHIPRKTKNGICWKGQKDDMDVVTIPTPYLQQFFYVIQSHVERIMIWILF